MVDEERGPDAGGVARCWREIPQSEVDALVRGWNERLRRCVRGRGASIARKRRVAKKGPSVFDKVTRWRACRGRGAAGDLLNEVRIGAY